MKTLLLSISFMTISTTAFANGISIRGGGDTCEEQIKVIRNDIKSWLAASAGYDLQLPKGLPVYKYSSLMLQSIESSKIRCVSKGDDGYPVKINQTAKVCRFDIGAEKYITCDSEKFRSLRTEDQYSLIHHEFAGIAQLEVPNEDDSNYQISEQIPRFLKEMRIQRLTFGTATDRVILSCQDDSNILEITLTDKNEIIFQRTSVVVPEVFYIGDDFNDLNRVIISGRASTVSRVSFQNPKMKLDQNNLRIGFNDSAASSLNIEVSRNSKNETIVSANSPNKELSKGFIRALGFKSSQLLHFGYSFVCEFKK